VQVGDERRRDLCDVEAGLRDLVEGAMAEIDEVRVPVDHDRRADAGTPRERDRAAARAEQHDVGALAGDLGRRASGGRGGPAGRQDGGRGGGAGQGRGGAQHLAAAAARRRWRVRIGR
jgi:hypothetical protein